MQTSPTATDSISKDGASQPSQKKARKPRSSKQQHPVQPQSSTSKETPRREQSPQQHDHASRISNVREQSQPPPPPSRFTAHLQPYPGPHYPVVTPAYPMNGNPYHNPPSPFHQPNPGTPVNGQSPHIGPGIPGHHQQYPYPVHPSYSHQPYPPPYGQYAPPGMMMYGTPGPSPDPGRSSADPSSASGSMPTTGKRKNSTSDMSRNGQSAAAEAKKRTKTQRACDSCRSRKIRCDILADADPPICQHCKQYGFECTFFLPITETRFKKKKLEEEAAAAAAAEKEKEAERGTSSPADLSKADPKVYAMISSRTYETYDMRYHHYWDVSTRDGVIQVNEPQQSEVKLSHPKPVDMRIERDVVQSLVNAYFEDVAPLLPVVTKEEFLATNQPPPILLYSICLVAATRRDVPQAVFDSIRYAVNTMLRQEDVLSTASIVNVQSLLILAMCGDCHSQSVPKALSALWVRLGCAIRMAQDLGLHRAESVKQNIELRRRLWGICVISDRWISLTYGHPFMIDVQDCDARLPSSGDPNDVYMDELVRLSVILGRVLKTIYTPAGLTVTNDDALYSLLADLEAWKNRLPDELRFHGPDSPRSAGILFLFYACVNMIFWRVFMRISYSCPAHLKFFLTVEKWTELVKMTADAIDWLDAHDRSYDVWLLVAYCATSCALVQYHTWARRRDQDAQGKLKKLRDCVRKWEASLSPDHMSARRKTAEIIALLYEATQGPQQPPEAPVLNPTGGVKVKPPLGGLVFKKDPTRPGGGIFIAVEKPNEELVKDLPEGVIMRGSDDEREGTGAGGPRNSQPGQSSLVNLTPLGGVAAGSSGNFPNMNPALNNPTTSGGEGNVQLMNMLDAPPGNQPIEHMNEAGFLDVMPGSMFDWGQWDNFFSRFAPHLALYQQPQPPGGGPQQQQQQQQQSQQPPQPPQNQYPAWITSCFTFVTAGWSTSLLQNFFSAQGPKLVTCNIFKDDIWQGSICLLPVASSSSFLSIKRTLRPSTPRTASRFVGVSCSMGYPYSKGLSPRYNLHPTPTGTP
ncbi:hypothetical protein ABKN59_002483 [Abortiporus biennis]